MKSTTAVLLGVAGMLVGIATAVANANHRFEGHPALAYWFYGAAIILIATAIVGALVDAIRKPGEQGEQQRPPISIHLENIGNPVHDQSTRQALAPTSSATVSERHPNLELFDCKPGFLYYDNSVWCEADPSELDPKEDQPNSCLAIFRNKPAPTGQAGVPAFDVTAHLTYRNKKGEQQMVNFGTWVGTYEHFVDFTRAESHALVLSSTVRAGKDKDGRVYVLDNPHRHNPFAGRFRSGMVVYAPDEKPMIQNCNEVEISLLCKNITVYSGKLRLADESGDATQFKESV